MATFLSEGWIKNEATMRLRKTKIDLFGNHKTQVDYPQRVRERMRERERERMSERERERERSIYGLKV